MSGAPHSRRIAGLALLLTLLAAAGALRLFSPQAVTARRDGVAMDTIVAVSLTAREPRSKLEGVLDEAFAELERMENLFSMHDPASRLSALNAANGDVPTRVDAELYALLRDARALSRRTGGAFDPTVGPLTTLWDEALYAETPALPASGDIAAAAALVDREALFLPESGDDTAFLARKGMKLDLGGIAKGYASGRVADIVRRAGVPSALIDLGGNVVLVGARPDGDDWNIGIQSPERPRGVPAAILSLRDTAVVTAGVYERYAEVDGRRYTHILDPRSGFPVEGALLSATIVADDPVAGDALSTACVVAGVADALALLAEFPGAEAVFILSGDVREVVATGGLRGRITLPDGPYTLRFVEVRR